MVEPPRFPYVEAARHDRWSGPPPLHLGYWEDPDGGHRSTADAQQALEDRVFALAGLGDRRHIVDVGCGLGATVARMDGLLSDAQLLGVNVDPKQIDRCRTLRVSGRNHVSWVRADATHLPLAESRVDRIVCIEAAPHFRSRRWFLSEAARVLRPGGILVGTDLFVLPGTVSDSAFPDTVCEQILREGTGSWPRVFEPHEEIRSFAEQAGFDVFAWVDISDHVAPNFTSTTEVEPDAEPVARMVQCLGLLQHTGRLRSIVFGLERRH
jgi:cyclopropane fatty-acyl-phospholipid synthase-like methyltransferase